ncbi:histone H2B type 1-M-like [Carcharodon carcharias]|uniref:histone H2B type 1-M-like n=1 Tax=Carcharodon carcharias TaxID=13397 RepID=UPI001B7F577E|nr:histone H2B type 1-M-like [Carcharodon carcharias]
MHQPLSIQKEYGLPIHFRGCDYGRRVENPGQSLHTGLNEVGIFLWAARAAAKSSVPHKASKQLLNKVTKKPSRKRRKSRKQSYSTYMYRALSQVHPFTRISSKAMSVMNSFVVDIFRRITSQASHLIHYNKHHVISAREIQSTIHLMLPWELAKHIVSEGTKALTKYTNSV